MARGVTTRGAGRDREQAFDSMDRFDKFTDRARKVLTLAQDEAQRFNHNYIGTEHLLLGLVREGEGVAARVLENMNVELPKVRTAVEFIIGRGDRPVVGEVGLTPRAKRVIELAKEAGAKRAIRLPVAGAFHSPLMAPAAEGLEAALAESELADPSFPVYSNVTANAVTSGDEAGGLLVRQLTSPVRWVDLIRNLAAAYPEALYVEMGPGSVLTGLLPRIVPGLRGQACGTPGDVEKLLAQVA